MFLPCAVLRFALVVADAWITPFVGDFHTLLTRNIQRMHAVGMERPPGDRRYHMNYASIIQSSGSGKSRLVDEVAKQLFTIPLNVRNPMENGMQDSPSHVGLHSSS